MVYSSVVYRPLKRLLCGSPLKNVWYLANATYMQRTANVQKIEMNILIANNRGRNLQTHLTVTASRLGNDLDIARFRCL